MADQSFWLSTAADVASAITAVVALGVAFLSIKISNKALAIQEKHNRLSVKPIPFIALADYENLVRAKITNAGSGPLIVQKVVVDSKSQTHSDIISHMPTLPEGIYWSTFTSQLEKRALLPGEELILLQLDVQVGNSELVKFRDQCRDHLASLTVNVQYTDIYDTKFAKYSRCLEWFSREKGTRPAPLN